MKLLLQNLEQRRIFVKIVDVRPALAQLGFNERRLSAIDCGK